MSRAPVWAGSLLAVVALALWPWAVHGEEGGNGGIHVVVTKEGEAVTVHASYLVPVTARVAWEVLTDYERMEDFLPQLRSSAVLARSENKLRVSQSGRIFFGPIPVPFDYLRDVELTPYREIRSLAVGGSLKSGEVITQLVPQGSATHITYQSKAVPNIWVPLGIGEAFIRNSVQAQLAHMRDEMMRWEKRAQKVEGGL